MPTMTSTSLPTPTALPSTTPTEAPTSTPTATDELYRWICCDLTQLAENQGLTEKQKEFVTALMDAKYNTYFGQPVQFHSGIASYMCRTASTPACYVYLTQEIVFGDLNSDGIDDAVAITTLDEDNTLYDELAVFVNRNGKPHNVATIYVEWYSIIKQLRIDAGVITLDFFKHRETDSDSSPTQPETWHLKLMNGKLIRLP